MVPAQIFSPGKREAEGGVDAIIGAAGMMVVVSPPSLATAILRQIVVTVKAAHPTTRNLFAASDLFVGEDMVNY